MAKSIEDRIKESFNQDDKEEAFKYMDWINSSIIAFTQTIRRNASLLVLLVAIFELIVGSRDATLSIGSFKISRNSITLTFLPGVISFFFMQIILDSAKVNRLYYIFFAVFKIWSPEGSINELDQLLDQPLPTYWSMSSTSIEHQDRLDKLEIVSSTMLLWAVIIGVIAFEGQAYYVLFPAHASAIIPWAVSLLLTLFFLVFGILFMATA